MALEGFDLESFAQALSVPTQEALAALPEIQKRPEAWQLAFDLLASNNSNCRFFGAHTLHAKISRDWDTLDAERQSALRDELIRLAVENSGGALNVLNKLSQALAAYALLMPADAWDGFLNSVVTALQKQAQNTGMSAGAAIVDFLEVFPEELNRTALAAAQQGRLVQDVKAALPLVLQILISVVRGLEGSVRGGDAAFEQLGQSVVWRTRAWKAIQQWLQFGVPSDTLFVPLLDVCLQQLCVLAAHRLRSDGHDDDDEIQAAAAAADDMVSNMKVAAKYSRSVGTLVLEHLGQKWVGQILDHSARDSGHDARAWSAVAISFGETYTDFIVSGMADAGLSEHVGAFLQLMVALTRFPGHHGFDEDVSDQPLSFWYLLQEALVDYEAEAEPGAAAAVAAAARNTYADVLRALVAKSAFPAAATWLAADRDERERFASYRREVGDALLNAYYVLRSDMLGALVDEVHALGALTTADWQHAEALLFALRSIGEAVPSDEAVHLPRLFAADALTQHLLPVLQVRADGDRASQWALTSLKAGVIAVVGAYGDWWRGRGELLAAVVPSVATALHEPALVPTAVSALRRICDSCRDELGVAAASLVQLACDVLGAGAAVPAREQQRIFEAVAEVVLAQPPDTHAAALLPLTSALLAALRVDVARLESSLSASEPAVAALIDHLRLVEALARGLQFGDDVEEHALAGDADATSMLAYAARCYQDSALHEFRIGLLAVLDRALVLLTAMSQPDDTLLECMLATVNSAVRRSPHAFALPFADSVAFVGRTWSVAVARPGADFAPVFSARWADQCPALLQSISQLATVAVPDAESTSDATDRVLGSVLARAIDDVCAGLAREAATLPVAIEQQPIVSEYVFDLCTRVLQTRPALLAHVEHATVARLCTLSVHALAVPNRLALKPTAYFLTALIRLSATTARPSPATPLLASLWSEFGPEWLRATLQGIGGAHPRSLLPNLAELLFAMVRHHLQSVKLWMAELLAQPAFPSPHADDAAKRQFVQHLLATRSFVRAKAIVNEFSVCCRNLQGTAYAA
ncbi:hypothetical protein LPJ77_002521 [Coemansia sp. RSA 2523]|nr:hypothetical protein LPJ77_002521 [Coemansia sp. RSA 2523]KAJ2292834.1 hypothetical protein IW141_001658 [Coemansia sp. RSA 355]KAJ2568524.1 hypothetical protein GGH19_005494 [Coemansia sp. RSA 1807]KAJ2729872.1 hypothetical protein H4S00_000254 [Coemansia sp. D1744]